MAGNIFLLPHFILRQTSITWFFLLIDWGQVHWCLRHLVARSNLGKLEEWYFSEYSNLIELLLHPSIYWPCYLLDLRRFFYDVTSIAYYVFVIFLAGGVVIAGGIIMSLSKFSRNGVRMIKKLFIGMLPSPVCKCLYYWFCQCISIWKTCLGGLLGRQYAGLSIFWLILFWVYSSL